MSLAADIVAAALRPLVREARSAISWDDYLSFFNYGGHSYPLLQQTLVGSKEEVGTDYAGLAAGAYKSNGVVFACELVRQMVFSEARFQGRRLVNGRPGELFSFPDLAVLEAPWPGATTGDLLTRSLLYADLGGTAFFGRRREGKDRRENRIRVMRPDWVVMILGSPSGETSASDAELAGLVYYPDGRNSGKQPEVFAPGEFAYFAPTPDPTFRFRGLSWLVPAMPHILGHKVATVHKRKFFENGATPNMVVSLDKEITPDQFNEFVDKMEEGHTGYLQAYKTLYLAGGATATVVGKDFQQLDFKNTQGADETLIAAAAGVPPVIVGLSEGLQAATYSNYAQARRRFADGTMRPLWRDFAHSLQSIIDVPDGAELWYDDRDIPFLREDQKDEAEIQSRRMLTIESGIRGGFKPETVVAAVVAGDLSLMEHTGLYSVQLQPPQPDGPPPDDAGRALARLIAPHLPPADEAGSL